jgi:DNA-binding transcriptional MocR family regulator
MADGKRRKKHHVKPSREVSAEREARAWQLRVEGLTQRAIAKELGIGLATVNNALQRVAQRVQAGLNEERSREIATQLSRHEWIFAESVAGWKRSQQPAETTRTRISTSKTPGEQDKKPEVTKEMSSRGQSGDPRFLEQASKALSERRRLLGIESVPPGDEANTPIDPRVAEAARKAALAEAERIKGEGAKP